MKQRNSDIAVVGAGVIGLAIALAAARRGKRVVLFERDARAMGASIRNFGLVLPMSQPPGRLHDRALRSREIWLELATAINLYHSKAGLLALAHHEDEHRVLTEYVQLLGQENHGRRLLTRTQIGKLSSAVKTDGLTAALHSPTEVVVDPRQAISKIPKYLREQHDVVYHPSTPVHAVGSHRVETTNSVWTVDEVFVCSGSDISTLYPAEFASSGLQRVKLQMLRTSPQPSGYVLGPALCAGLSLTHYPAFKTCPSLPDLQKRFENELPFHVKNGIHLLLTQTATGEITIGDSHQYDDAIDPFDSEAINVAMLEYLNTFAHVPDMAIHERWHGIYAKHPSKTDNVMEPEPGVTLVNGLGGAGMTHAFGLAEEMALSRNW